MKQWFPFTDYDFYAYLTAGVILITAVDYAFFGGVLIAKKEWPVVHIVFWIATAYVVGQITANPSALLLEQWLARRFLNSPVSVLLGLKPQRLRERFIRDVLVGRVYEPLAEPIRRQILGYSTRKLKLKNRSPIAPEVVFNIAYPIARTVTDSAARMDQFRNLYGFCRNTSFVAAIACVFILIRASRSSSLEDYWIAFASFLVAVGMFGRFIKFYSEFSAEMLRTFHSTISKKEHDR